ncbi:hypothetical protein G8V07_11570 [Clostridium botulinum D/C]|nr:hypothetical protein [Clostridium botulinum]MCD3319522.1 hypothetical protein [Clostridium botulinum D/C]MCD3324387.1 hypothetical protein [Clostridium botulinum D/C]MCD3327821.1 hypothetical protein [Clostridium botulinum D/C]
MAKKKKKNEQSKLTTAILIVQLINIIGNLLLTTLNLLNFFIHTHK